jgi:hypothetical protein
MAGAPHGNTNASKDNRLFGDALRRAIVQDEAKRLRASVEKLLDKAADGDLPSIQALADRLDGKPTQALTGPDGEALITAVILKDT